jgi:hypothetical protein
LAVARPTRLDIAAVNQTLELLRRRRPRALLVLNQCPPREEGAETDLVEHAVEALRQAGILLAEPRLRAHTAYQQAQTSRSPNGSRTARPPPTCGGGWRKSATSSMRPRATPTGSPN